jgi:GT2 family glycosyltransferase
MITVVLIHTKKSEQYTHDSIRMLKEQGIEYVVVDGDGIKPFNYNHALNMGAQLVNTEYALFANNDLIYHPGWDQELISAMNLARLRSASPYCHKSSGHHGFTAPIETAVGAQVKWTGKWLVGWALCLRMDLWKEMGGFDERVDFWFSDNIYEWQLKQRGELHAMITRARVDHIGSVSLNQLQGAEKEEATMAQHKKYIDATGHAITFWGW